MNPIALEYLMSFFEKEKTVMITNLQDYYLKLKSNL